MDMYAEILNFAESFMQSAPEEDVDSMTRLYILLRRRYIERLLALHCALRYSDGGEAIVGTDSNGDDMAVFNVGRGDRERVISFFIFIVGHAANLESSCMNYSSSNVVYRLKLRSKQLIQKNHKQLMLNTFKKLDKDNNTKVIILEGAGKGFSAGHNLKEVRSLKVRSKYLKLFNLCSKVMIQITS